jgi:succinoglycan biosynthesis protein ExoU
MTAAVPPAELPVDVLIAAWNRSDTIGRAVSSALAQPEVRRVIVVDDGSTDDTAACAQKAGAGSCRMVVASLASNSGPSAARNHGLDISTAPWVAILDGDDYFLPGRIGKMLAVADGYDFIADDILLAQASDNGQVEPRPMMFDPKFEPWPLDFASFVLGNSGQRGRSRMELGYFKPMMRRAFLDRGRLRYDERLRLGEDYALYAHALAQGARFLVVPASGYVFLTRSGSLSARHSKQDLERHRDTDIELGEIPTLSNKDRDALKAHYRTVDGRAQWVAVVEAFKARNPVRFLTPFARSPEVRLFLLRKLYEEAYRRLLAPLARTGD